MKRPNLYDRLKVIAILTMIIDHVGYVLLPEISWLRLVGRIAFPIFLFLVGFNGNYKRRWDLLGFAIVVQIPIFVASVWYGFGSGALNILFGIILGRVILNYLTPNPSPAERGANPPAFSHPLSQGGSIIVMTIMLLLIHPWLKEVVDYGSFVILFPLMGFLFKSQTLLNPPSKGGLHCSSPRRGGRVWSLLYSVLIFACLFGFTQMVFGFSSVQLYVLGVFFILLLCIFFLLGQGNRFLPIGKKIDASVLFVSKNALLIYVFHLLVMWVIKIFLISS